MSTYASSTNGNGNGTAPYSTATETAEWESVFQPESPFLADPALAPRGAGAAPPAAASAVPQQGSPFLSEYTGEGDTGPRAAAFTEVVTELADTEFSEALEDLVNEALAVAEDRFSSETADPATARGEAERAVRGYLQPIARAAEATLDRMSEALSGVDAAAATESEIETLLEQFAAPRSDISPVADQFLGGLVKKAKSAINAAKKIASYLPQNLILGKLKALVRPLLERVLRAAIDRIPVALRPVAKQLARRFLGVSAETLAADEMEEEQEERDETASVDPAQLEHELDSELAGYVLDGESFEEEAAVERAVADELAPTGDALGELARCRQRFARRVTRLRPGEDVQPVVEEFVPAILAALKLGISVIGRPRVVKYLAGLVANLIKKYVGEEQATALSGALVDAGLRTVSLETRADESPAAGYALGATVEDTVARLVADAPAAAWENEDMLAAHTFEAFQQAASAHFPDSEIRDDLHEAAHSSGAWVARPERSPYKAYKKYTRVLDVTITPQAAAAVQTFGGIPLRAFLADRLGVNATKPVRARAHLFEALPGTSLGLIALREKGVPGLGTAGRAGRSLIHPLTPEAASALFGEPALGRPVSPAHLARRGRVAVGQRFYYLEIPGARVRLVPRHEVPGTRPARSSQPRVVLDLLKRELRVFLYLSEADAQTLTGQLRQRAPVAALLAALRGVFGAMFRRVAADPTAAVKIIHESAPTESHESGIVATVKRTIGRVLGDKAQEWVFDIVRRELDAQYERLAGELEKATAHEADGVTLRVALQVPVLDKLRALYKPTGWFGIAGIVRAFRKARVTGYELKFTPGYAVK